MASGASVKLGVTGVSSFKDDIKAVKESIKTLDEHLGLVEKQFEKTGDAESYLQEKAELLNAKLEGQKSILQDAESALQSMEKNGVDKASRAFQEMQRQVIEAKGGIIDTEAEIAALESTTGQTGENTKSMNGELRAIGKGVAFENVTNGLGTLIDKLEKGAKAAVNLGKKIAKSAMDSTGWADDILTEATKYGTDAETIQRMQNVAEFVDTDVDTILNAKARLAKNKDKLSDTLGIDTNGKSVDDAFWEAGEAIMAMTDEFEKEEAAQKIFGKSWKDLVPLFTVGQEEYNRLMEEQNVLTNEQVENLGKADDAIKKVQQEVELLKNQFWAENADKITEVLQWMVDNQEAVVGALTAIAGAFGALKLGEAALNIAKVVKGFETLWGGADKKLPNISGLGGGSGTSGGTGGGTGGIKGLLGRAKEMFGAAGGMSTLGFGALMALAGYTGYKMIEANMNDEQTNQVYGDKNGLDLLDRMTGEQFRLAQEYEKIYNNPEMTGTEEAFAAREALQESLKKLGIDRDDLGVELLENIFDERMREMDIDGMVEKFDRLSEAAEKMEETASELSGNNNGQQKSNSEMTSAVSGLKGLPGDVASAVAAGMSGVSVYMDGSKVGYLVAPFVSSALGGRLAGR